MSNTSDVNADYEQFVQKVKTKTGIDLHAYKQQQMQRRLSTLRQRRGYGTFVDYFHAMVHDAKIMNEFLDQMTINFSEFFRNPEKWQVLKNRVLPQITSRRGNIRFWSAACSTGEEPYTLAMMLSEINNLTFEIQATDIDQQVLNRALRGVYSSSAIQQVPKHLAQRFLERTSTGEYQVSEVIKKKIAFSRHNLLADPYKKGFDLIICRNVLIYFKDDAKEQIIHRFAQSLDVGGYLFVGGTEHLRDPKVFGLEATADMFFYRKAGK